MNLAKRLGALEVIYRPADRNTLTEHDRRWYLGLCRASKVEAIWTFAGWLAQRRYHHGRGAGTKWTDDWKDATTVEDRNALIVAEVERFLAMDAGDDTALTAWIETADLEGWPALKGPIYPMSRDGFESMLTHARQDIDMQRGRNTPDAVAWRRDHPEWRPGMTGDEALAFELALDIEAHQLQDEWFPAQQVA